MMDHMIWMIWGYPWHPTEVEMLGWMQGGYNVAPLVEALELDQDQLPD